VQAREDALPSESEEMRLRELMSIATSFGDRHGCRSAIGIDLALRSIRFREQRKGGKKRTRGKSGRQRHGKRRSRSPRKSVVAAFR